jgi:uncharacterized protein DUF1937
VRAPPDLAGDDFVRTKKVKTLGIYYQYQMAQLTPIYHPYTIEQIIKFDWKGKLVYLACPYSHPNEHVRLERSVLATTVTHDLFVAGVLVFSPITYAVNLKNHAVSRGSFLETGWETWQKLDIALLDRCDVLVVLVAPGWDVSKGVQAEITHACQANKPIFFLTPP